MNGRAFLRSVAVSGAGVMLGPAIVRRAAAQTTAASGAPSPQHPADVVEAYFRSILDGFLRNAAATSSNGGFAVCDFPGGTKLKTCCTPAGKSYVSVARMLPAIAELASRPALE